MTIKRIRAREDDILRIIKLSEEIVSFLTEEGKSDFFEGVGEDFHSEAMNENSITIVAEDKGNIVGFLLLSELSEEERQIYINEFHKRAPEEMMILKSYGVTPKLWGCQLGRALVETGKHFATQREVTTIVGTIHPMNIPAITAIACTGKTHFGMSKVLKASGRDTLIRKMFINKF